MTGEDAEHLTEDGDFIPPGRNCAKVTGVRRDLFVEFEFIAGDPTLAVELILPIPAFNEFCTVNDVLMLEPPNEEVGHAYQQLCWRHGVKPGRPDVVLAR